MPETPLFTAGSEGYHTYRIPALAVSSQGTVLAFCEGRRHSRSDAGEIDLLLRRSSDSGRTWEETQVVVSEPAMTCGNPCPVVDGDNGTIWLPFTKNLAEGPESMVIAGQAPRTVWLTHSENDGASWADPVEITADVKPESWTWYATGPGHGIQLPSGRLVVPCDHIVGVEFARQDPHHSHVILSDDHGATWRVGGRTPNGTNESAVALTADGGIYINCRSRQQRQRRGVAWSHDEGESFVDFRWEDLLVEPECQGSLVRLSASGLQGRDRLLFANPASTERCHMMIRASYDGGQTWPVARLLNAGPSAYSDLCILPDGNIGCLYERGESHPYEQLSFARFDTTWLEGVQAATSK